jgi:hypothetical protein
MNPETLLSAETTRIIGIVLLTVPAIAFGGTFLLRVVQGAFPATPLQTAFFRAGHAHAGVLVTLGILVSLVTDLAGTSGLPARLATGVLLSAILIPAGFFLSVSHRGAQKPSALIGLLWLGVIALATGVISAGISLLGNA